MINLVTSVNMDSKQSAPRLLGWESSCQGPILRDAEAEGLTKNKRGHSNKSRNRSDFRQQRPSKRLSLGPAFTGLQRRDAQSPHVAARKPRPHRPVRADDRSQGKIRSAINVGYRMQQKRDAP